MRTESKKSADAKQPPSRRGRRGRPAPAAVDRRQTQARRLSRLLRIGMFVREHHDKEIGVHQIAAAVGVSRRTLFRDLEVLRMAGIKLEYCAQDRTFRMPSLALSACEQLSAPELAALMVLLEARRIARPGSALSRSLESVRRKMLALLWEELGSDCPTVKQLVDEYRADCRDRGRRE